MTSQYLFFPFTHVTQHQLRQVSAFFPQVSYLPLQHEDKDLPHIRTAVEAGQIKRIALPANHIDTARQNVLQYTQWAKIHKGNERNLKAIIKDSAYFTSDTHVSSIKSQIRGTHVDEKARISTSSPEKDLLFLSMAQMCDEQNEQINLEFQAVEKNRGNLFAALRGPEDPMTDISQDFSCADTDAGLTMTGERIAAWAGGMALAGGMNENSKNCFLVTTSPGVMDYLESNCTDVINALDIDQIKVHENNCAMKTQWQHQFCESLMSAVHGEGIREKDLPTVTDRCEVSGKIKVCIFSGDLINDLLKTSGTQIVVCLVNLK
ncbi:MAG: hypothetical protein KKE62_00110 [Proteobacteria bacterium]|nr:hypothetical protein [Pseudomonadota bacterium]MBU1389402.1 hypothetical protein [Pseudomonadota bacterium]MBU1541222.1 hypothetical protein [Pseudomonadota bacterium]MBU2479647.1 hypothetical protein [Pseudomonadota bacterium]